jgi:hypothetical protein
MDKLGLIQWPAMVASVVAAWLVAAQSERRRKRGFWVFLASNVLWIAWGWHTKAWALIALQVALIVLNVRGAKKNEEEETQTKQEGRGGGSGGRRTENR